MNRETLRQGSRLSRPRVRPGADPARPALAAPSFERAEAPLGQTADGPILSGSGGPVATGFPAEPLLLRIEQVANMLSLGRSKTYELIQRGELPSVHLGRCVRVPSAALRRWLDAREAGDRSA